MDTSLIEPGQWQRWLAGMTPAAFLAEIALRAIVVYLALIVAMRVLGRRVAAQLTLFELSVVVTLAATAGMILESSERGLVPALVVIFATVALYRLLSYLGARNRAFEHLVNGRVATVVEDGRLLLHPLRVQTLSHERLFAALRGQGVQHLGEISRLFTEPSGAFTVVRAERERPGLSLLPDIDRALREQARAAGVCACSQCGYTVDAERAPAACRYCGSGEWTIAVQRLKD